MQHGLGAGLAVLDPASELDSPRKLPGIGGQKRDPHHGAILPDQPVDFPGDLERINQNGIGQLPVRFVLIQLVAVLFLITGRRCFSGFRDARREPVDPPGNP